MQLKKLVLASLTTILILFSSCSTYQPEHNVILIVMDTLRWDHVSAYGSDKAETPNLNSIANSGVLFNNAYSHIPITMPSHTSMFTSRLPHEVNVFNNRHTLEYDNPTLTELLKEKGYKTGAIISLGVLRHYYNLSRGFDSYFDKIPDNGIWYKRADDVTDEGIAYLESIDAPENPFFLFLHYSDPHGPYSPPGAPTDTEILHNGESKAKLTVATLERYEIPINLRPGKNEITINKLLPHTGLLVQEIGVKGDYVINSSYPSEWKEELEKAKKIHDKKFFMKFNELMTQRLLFDEEKHQIDDLTIRLDKGWEAKVEGPNNANRRTDNTASIIINNRGGKVIPVSFVIRGKVTHPVEKLREFYAQEVEYADQQIGRLLSYLKEKDLYDNSIIIFTSDHGEEFEEHGKIGHIHHLYEESLHVPLIIKPFKGFSDSANKPVSQLVGLIDLAPTILDAVGIAIPGEMTGVPLLSEEVNYRQDHQCETFIPSADFTSFGLREGSRLGIFKPMTATVDKYEFYQRDNDPDEYINLALSDKREFGDFAHELRKTSDAIESTIQSSMADSEHEDMLRDLGYIAASTEVFDGANVAAPDTEKLKELCSLMADCPDVSGLSAQAEMINIEENNAKFPYILLKVNSSRELNAIEISQVQRYFIKKVKKQVLKHHVRLNIVNNEITLLDQMFPAVEKIYD